jgi:MFS family permease
VLGIRLLPETRRFVDAPSVGRGWINWSALRWALGSSAIGPVILTFFLATLGFAAFETTLALFLRDTLDFPEAKSYLIFAYIGLVLIITQGFLYRRLARRWSESTFMVIGICFMALGLAGLGFVTLSRRMENSDNTMLMTLVFVALAFAVVGFAFLTPSAQALISRRTSLNQQGEILGVNQSASALSRILGPPIGITLLKVNPLLPFVFGAGILVLMLPLMPRVRRG